MMLKLLETTMIFGIATMCMLVAILLTTGLIALVREIIHALKEESNESTEY